MLSKIRGTLDKNNYITGSKIYCKYNQGVLQLSCQSFERFIALLIEHYAGKFPLWLAPLQVIVLPIADRHVEYAHAVEEKIREAGLRVKIDSRQEKIGYKIREAQLRKVPYMLVVGDRESSEGTVSVRNVTLGDQGSQALESFVKASLEEVRVKRSPAEG